MGFEVRVTAQIGLHVGETKFYETLLFERTDEGHETEQALIKHFGKRAQFKGGGQTKIEAGPGSAMGASSIWKEKGKPKEYSQSFPGADAHGFYRTGIEQVVLTRTASQNTSVNIYSNAEGFIKAMEEHKIDGVTRETILQKLGYRDEYDPNDGAVVEEMAPEPDRTDDPDWGAW